MAVEKMKLLSITGKEENIDVFIEKYLLDSGIQTEDAAKVFEKGWKLTNFKYDSKAKELLKECQNLLDKCKIKYDDSEEIQSFKYTTDEIEIKLKDISDNLLVVDNKLNELNKKYEDEKKKELLVKDTKDLDIDLDALYNMEYVKFRYGKIAKENINRLQNSIVNLNAIIYEISVDEEDNVWIICVATRENSAKVDSYLNLFKFERFYLPEEMKGNPKKLWLESKKEIERLEEEINETQIEKNHILKYYKDEIIELYEELNLYIKINNVKRYMAYDENGLFYIIGWIPARELNVLLPKLVNERDVKYAVKSHDEVASTPPTKLNNIKIFKPFETLIKMYGLPNYTELDPTPFVAITAFLIFGFMFGDVGQGLVIFLIGLLLAKKKVSMGPIFEAGGISAIIFGFLYGSVFGSEDILKPILISPMDNIQTMLIYGIAIGVVLIISAMILNIKNGIKNKDKQKIFFDTNGIAGLVFYILVLGSGIYYLKNGKMIVSFSIMSIFIILPLAVIMFKDVLAEKVFKQKSKEKSSIAERIFEVVEILLSFASNTISFVRIAAFAINHVGLCMAVYILSDMFAGAGSLTVKIFGNILVIVLEGLIVAIQVLRLEYYELFSRFYMGNGKEYKPLKEKI